MVISYHSSDRLVSRLELFSLVLTSLLMVRPILLRLSPAVSRFNVTRHVPLVDNARAVQRVHTRPAIELDRYRGQETGSRGFRADDRGEDGRKEGGSRRTSIGSRCLISSRDRKQSSHEVPTHCDGCSIVDPSHGRRHFRTLAPDRQGDAGPFSKWLPQNQRDRQDLPPCGTIVV